MVIRWHLKFYIASVKLYESYSKLRSDSWSEASRINKIMYQAQTLGSPQHKNKKLNLSLDINSL